MDDEAATKDYEKKIWNYITLLEQTNVELALLPEKWTT